MICREFARKSEENISAIFILRGITSTGFSEAFLTIANLIFFNPSNAYFFSFLLSVITLLYSSFLSSWSSLTWKNWKRRAGNVKTIKAALGSLIDRIVLDPVSEICTINCRALASLRGLSWRPQGHHALPPYLVGSQNARYLANGLHRNLETIKPCET